MKNETSIEMDTDNIDGYWYVVSTYSRTDRRCLLQVHTRRMLIKQSAELELEWLQQEHMKKKMPKYKRKEFGLIYVDVKQPILAADVPRV